MAARAGFSGPFYPAMGNHECTGYTDSNCGAGNPDGITKNLTAFESTMLAPIGETAPYYTETWRPATVAGPRSSWSSRVTRGRRRKSTWLTGELAKPTTYTFVVRHESVSDMSQTKCTASQTIVKAQPLTLLIVGHTHEYSHEKSDKEIINGIGGAPLTSGTNYGYTIVSRPAGGS